MNFKKNTSRLGRTVAYKYANSGNAIWRSHEVDEQTLQQFETLTPTNVPLYRPQGGTTYIYISGMTSRRQMTGEPMATDGGKAVVQKRLLKTAGWRKSTSGYVASQYNSIVGLYGYTVELGLHKRRHSTVP